MKTPSTKSLVERYKELGYKEVGQKDGVVEMARQDGRTKIQQFILDGRTIRTRTSPV